MHSLGCSATYQQRGHWRRAISSPTYHQKLWIQSQPSVHSVPTRSILRWCINTPLRSTCSPGQGRPRTSRSHAIRTPRPSPSPSPPYIHFQEAVREPCSAYNTPHGPTAAGPIADLTGCAELLSTPVLGLSAAASARTARIAAAASALMSGDRLGQSSSFRHWMRALRYSAAADHTVACFDVGGTITFRGCPGGRPRSRRATSRSIWSTAASWPGTRISSG